MILLKQSPIYRITQDVLTGILPTLKEDRRPLYISDGFFKMCIFRHMEHIMDFYAVREEIISLLPSSIKVVVKNNIDRDCYFQVRQ